MQWVLRLVETGSDGQSRSSDMMAISRPDDLNDLANLGLTLVEAKQLLAHVQRDVVAAQAGNQAMFRPDCQSCGGTCHVKDWRAHRIATVFGEVRLKLPRFLCAGCRCGETGVGWPSHRRSTPEESERHLEVRVGNVETADGGRQVFGAVSRADTDITALIRRTLEAVGRTDATKVTAFTDGCPGLRTILANAGVGKPPILDWFHIAMRLQHTKLAAENLSTDTLTG
jgi:hypothetical protein